MKIFLIGFMGSGKTHWGRIWANQAGMDFFDHDELIEQMEGKSIPAIFEMQGERYFREKESEVLRTFANKENCIIACGGGTPCFYGNMQWMNDNGTTIYLEAAPAQLMNRLTAEKDKRPLLNHMKDIELLSFIEQKFKEREPSYRLANVVLPVDALDPHSLEDILNF
jgi:shikimate kinase